MLKRLIKGSFDGLVKHRGPAAFALFSVARRITWAYNNEDLNFASNGERWVLNQLGRTGLATVFDVGANVGDWAIEVLTNAPVAEIYCYEAIPQTYAALTANIASHRVHTINKALSDEPGTLEFNASEVSVISSVYDVQQFDQSVRSSKVSVSCATGDLECDRLGITHIDLLKVDTEGHDFSVLSGFTKMLGQDAIDFIQFEYNGFTLIARRALFDFYNLLSKQYFICRLLPNGLELMGYERGMDNFVQSNWICVRKPLVTRALVERLNIRLPDGHRRAITLASLADHADVATLLG